jgi:CRP-like cAMP-binding protein
MHQGAPIETALARPARQRSSFANNAAPGSAPAAARNSLLAALPSEDRLQLVANGEEVELVPSAVLCDRGEPVRYVYFPTCGFISLEAAVDGSSSLEVGLVGFEGMAGAPLVLGVRNSMLQAVVRGAGRSLRISASAFRRELLQSAALRRTLERYVYVQMTQFANAVACNRFHVVEARLARWLLMTQDRARSDTFHMTHEFLAPILGVRRVGVTKAATSLQKRGHIRYSRGNITILDRPGLIASACTCYQADLGIYRRTLG